MMFRTHWGRYVAVVVLASAVAGSAHGRVRLRYSTRPGDSSTYQVVMDGSTSVFVADKSQRTNLRTEMFLTQQVTEARGNTVNVLTTIDSGSININGQQSPLPNIGQRVTSEMRPNGEILSSSGFQQLDTRNMQLVFPEEPVAVGSTWTSTIEPNLQVPVPLTVTYRVLAFERIKNYDCIKISSTVRSGEQSTIEGLALDVRADGTIYFAFNEGKMIRNDVKSSMRMILRRVIDNEPQSIITKMTMDMTMEHQF